MKKYFSILFIGAIFISGCKKDFLDLNENPNFPSKVPASSLLPAALVKTAGVVVDPNLDYVQVWMQFWSFSPNYAVSVDSRSYKFTNEFRQGLFTDIYTNAYDYQKIIDFAVEQKNPALEGMGRTMKSFLMQYAVDVYNNVPYSEAFKGAINQTPKYDNGKDVYDSLYIDLTKAVNRFTIAQESDFPDVSVDLLFGSDKATQRQRWIKLANTIRLRLLIRQSGRADRASYIQSHLADFSAGLNSFLQAGELAVVNPGFTNSDNKQNPFWASFGYSVAGSKTGNNDFYRVSQYEVNFYQSQGDVRLFYVANSTGSGTFFGGNFLGNEMGQQGNGALTYSDITSKDYRTASDAQPIMTDFESLFLQAEAVQRGWFAGNAKTIFNNAMVQSFTYDFDAVDGAGAGAFYYSNLLTPDARNNWDLATNKIQLIITQKWASLNEINFFEPWIEYRRTGFPAVPLSSNASRGPNIPVRYKYPQREYDLNNTNVSSQGTIDQFTSKIWWMP
jgi:hypothetical protein